MPPVGAGLMLSPLAGGARIADVVQAAKTRKPYEKDDIARSSFLRNSRRAVLLRDRAASLEKHKVWLYDHEQTFEL